MENKVTNFQEIQKFRKLKLTIKQMWDCASQDKFTFYCGLILHSFKILLSTFSAFILGYIINTYIQQLIDNNQQIKDNAFYMIVLWSLIILAIYIVSGICYALLVYLFLRFSYRFGFILREMILNKITKLSLKFLDTTQSGDLMSRASNDINFLAINMANSISYVLTLPFAAIAIFSILFLLSPYLAAITLCCYSFIFVINLFLLKKSISIYKNAQKEMGNLGAVTQELISNRKATQIFRQQEFASKIYHLANKRYTNTIYRGDTIISAMWPVSDCVQMILTGFIYAICVTFYYYKIGTGINIHFFDGDENGSVVTVGLMTVFGLLCNEIIAETSVVMRVIPLLQKVFVSSERVFQIINVDDEVDNGKITMNSTLGNIELKNVNFSYIKNHPVLKNVSLKINSGEKVALVGPTGSGKTTIANLLTRFYEIDSGQILLDGIDIRKISKKSLNELISVVLQETFLFNRTIKENLKFGKSDATDLEIVESAKIACAHDFIMQLPLAYNTVLSDSVVSNFSLGQLQLLALSRFFLKNTSILILDEATSLIDTKTEYDIQNAINNLTKNKTCIIIAHRLSTIVDCDKIYVIKDGEIIESGNHHELLSKKGYYYNLYTEVGKQDE